MAIQFVSIKCPECDADLQIEDGREYAFCTYCGAKVIIANDNERIYRTIDEAGVRMADTERLIRLKELEIEEREKARDRKSQAIAYGVALAFVIIGALICIVKPMAGTWGIMIGAYIAMFAYSKNDDKKKGVKAQHETEYRWYNTDKRSRKATADKYNRRRRDNNNG